MSVCMYKNTNQYQPVVQLAAFVMPVARLRIPHDTYTERAEGYVCADTRNVALTKPFPGYFT